MHCNVWEWCADVYGPYDGGPIRDPQGPAANSREKDLLTHVLRGGSWYDESEKARAANRWAMKPAVGSNSIGFRVLLEADSVPRQANESN
jgi:formylglycine-generating enzyme required for sulfatase activity